VHKLKNDDILYFLHIPKAAGMTFASIVEEHFDHESIFPGNLWDQLMPKLPINFSKYRLIRGHFGYGIRQLFPKKPVYVTMLRNPIERCISWYEFTCNEAEKYGDVRTFSFDKTYTLSEVIINEIHKRKRPEFKNFQTRLLSKDLPPSFSNIKPNKQHHESLKQSWSSSPVDSSDLEIAKQHLSEFPFFGLAERFEDSILLLCYTFCWRPIRKIVKRNITENRHTAEYFPKETIDTLVNLNKLDANLYNFAQELFENCFNKMIAELKEKYYEPRFEGMQFKQMIHEMLEKHYEENYDPL